MTARTADRRDGEGLVRAARLVGGALVVAMSLYFIVKASHLFTFDPVVLGKYLALKWVLMGHIAGGMGALTLGPFQLSTRFRARFRRAHRLMGRIYVGAIVVGGGCALVLASTTARSFGWPYAISLHVLASVWLVSAILAWRTAVRKRFDVHEEWAIRSYVATVAFVAQSLSFELPFVARLGTFAEVSGTVIWLSWTLPMMTYEGFRSLRSRRAPVARIVEGAR